MKMSEYRKLVSKTADIKGAKIGLRLATKNNKQTQVSMGVLRLADSTNQLVRELTPYLMGSQFTATMKAALQPPMASVGHDIVFLTRLFKVKLPTATKKVKLHGSRTENVLAFNTAVSSLHEAFSNTTLSPATKTVEKEVVLPSAGGKKEMRPLRVLDAEAQAHNLELADKAIVDGLAEVIRLYWGLAFDMFGQPPAPLFELNQTLLAPPVAEPAAPAKPGKKTKTKVAA